MITITTENAQSVHFNRYHHQSNIWSLRLLLSLRNEAVEEAWENLIEANLPDVDNELTLLEYELKDKVASREQKLRYAGKKTDRISDEQWTAQMRSAVQAIWQERLAFYEKNEADICNCTIYRNVEMLGDFISLNKVERALLLFAVMVRSFTPLNKYLKEFKLDSSFEEPSDALILVISTIATMLNRTVEEISDATWKTGKLYRVCGLTLLNDMPLDENMANIFEVQFYIESLLIQPHKNRDALIGKVLQKTQPPKLNVSDFAHATRHVGILENYLSGALAKREKGVNILIHGKPGTGKTELAGALAKQINAKLFAVPCTRRNGLQMERQDRFAAYKLCQSMASGQEKCIILFDEVEDVFISNYKESSGKAWVNSMLENNPAPAIWLTNDIDDIDQAYLRRFDYVLEMPEVSNEVRHAVAKRYFDGMGVEPAWLKNIAMQDGISPAQIEKAARVVSLAQGDNHLFDSAKIAETVLECSVRATGGKVSLGKKTSMPGYDLACLNTSMDVSGIIDGLKNHPVATFCFYGAPGTGKTALAKHMADRLGKKLLVKRASDIFGAYLGESEKHIASMFRQATEQDAVLVLDEADSFLSDRRGATRSWEVSIVNEILTWMEDFEGIFVCTTNLMEKIDQAALRRFAFKVRFDFLKPEQKCTLFKQELRRLNPQGAEANDAILRRVESLPSLAPGDFAAVSRQRAVLGIAPSATDLFVALEAECKAKGAMPTKIGF
ncbi:MAG: AAA family ATPase [Gallionella sp.]|nr:AAA family ATPase [Gallionella sp.]